MNTMEKWFAWWSTVGYSELRSTHGRRLAFATHICTANKVFTMEKSLGWGTMLKYS